MGREPAHQLLHRGCQGIGRSGRDDHPRGSVVDDVFGQQPALGGVDDGQLRLELLLLQFGFDDLDFGELVELLVVTLVVVLGRRELGGEERVDERGFAETGFTWR